MSFSLRAVFGTVLVSLSLASSSALAETSSPSVAEISSPSVDAASPTTEAPDRLLLAPLNLGVGMAPELEAGVEPVWQALLDHVESQPPRAASLHPDSANALWAKAIASLEGGEEGDLYAAYRQFAQGVAEHVEFGTLVMPVMVTRAASLRGRHAHWDGVRRRAQLPSDLGQGALISSGLIGSEVRMRGKIGAASLHVIALDANGNVLYEGQGGLDLIHELRRDGTRLETALRSDAFQDPKDLREGVEQALSAAVPGSPGSVVHDRKLLFKRS